MMTAPRYVFTLTRALALAAASWVATPVSAAPPPIADFAADTDFSLPALSPSGELVAFVTRVQGARAVVVLTRCSVNAARSCPRPAKTRSKSRGAASRLMTVCCAD
jgi:hypothetical protein